MIEARLRIQAPRSKRDELIGVLRCLKGPTEVAHGCCACWILQDADNDEVLSYVVRWDSRENLEAHLRSERFRRLLPYIELSVRPPELEINNVSHIGGIEFLVAVLDAELG